MLIIFCGFYGLIGYSYYLTLPCFLVGCNFAYALMMWSDPSNPILYRKITLVLYSIIGLIYFLFFINMKKEEKYSSYISTVYVRYWLTQGLIMTFMMGIQKDAANLPTYRKVIQLACTIIFVLLTSLLILNIVLYRITILWNTSNDLNIFVLFTILFQPTATPPPGNNRNRLRGRIDFQYNLRIGNKSSEMSWKVK